MFLARPSVYKMNIHTDRDIAELFFEARIYLLICSHLIGADRAFLDMTVVISAPQN